MRKHNYVVGFKDDNHISEYGYVRMDLLTLENAKSKATANVGMKIYKLVEVKRGRK